MQYTVDYFIKKFEAIPEILWNVGSQTAADGTHCALGHCDQDTRNRFNEQISLVAVFESIKVTVLCKQSYNCYRAGDVLEKCMDVVAAINNGETEEYRQDTPKQRILAALYDIKKMQEPKVKEVIRYVSVSPSLKKQIAELIDN